jgi:hypothetical protein
MKRIICTLFPALLVIAGCGADISAETVRDKDKQRTEVSKKMPGNDIPMDPADRPR